MMKKKKGQNRETLSLISAWYLNKPSVITPVLSHLFTPKLNTNA